MYDKYIFNDALMLQLMKLFNTKQPYGISFTNCNFYARW